MIPQNKLPHNSSDEFIPFPIERLLDNSVTDFDLYVRIGEHQILYSGLGYRWIKDELHSLLESGYLQLFTKRSDKEKILTYDKIAKLHLPDQNLAPKERIKKIEDVAATFVKCMHESEVTQACVAKAEEISTAICECLAEDKKAIRELSGLADFDYYTYFHSARVSMYSIGLGMAAGLQDDVLKKIGLGGLFHDIGKKEIPLTVLNKSGALTKDEWKHMKDHPLKGKSIVDRLDFHPIAKEIVTSHHERLDGSGYPYGLDAKSIPHETQLAAVADIFDALTSVRAYQVKRSRFEALALIKEKMIGTHINKDIFKALVACLAD